MCIRLCARRHLRFSCRKRHAAPFLQKPFSEKNEHFFGAELSLRTDSYATVIFSVLSKRTCPSHGRSA